MCSPKTMLKIGAVLAVILVVGAILFPQFRATIISLAPLALFAICPLSMIFCMKGMNKGNHDHSSCSSCDHDKVATERGEKSVNEHGTADGRDFKSL